MFSNLRSRLRAFLSPAQRRALGLDENWPEQISDEFLLRALEVAEKYRPVLEELSKQ